MKRSFRILLIVAVVLVSALVAAFTVPVNHQVTYVYTRNYFGFTWYNVFDNGVFVEEIGRNPAPTDYSYHSHVITWQYPDSPTFDFSWLR